MGRSSAIQDHHGAAVARHKRLEAVRAIGTPRVIDVIDTRRAGWMEQVNTEDGAHTTAFDRERQCLYVFLPRSCRAGVRGGRVVMG